MNLCNNDKAVIQTLQGNSCNMGRISIRVRSELSTSASAAALSRLENAGLVSSGIKRSHVLDVEMTVYGLTDLGRKVAVGK